MDKSEMEHKLIFGEKDVFAGWPANHGAWQNEDEILFGFLTGPAQNKKNQYHRIGQPYIKMLARTKDAGQSWKVEIPETDFSASKVGSALPPLTRRDILRFSGVYDTGGEDCVQNGGVYVSSDFGKSWSEPYIFPSKVNVLFSGHNQNTSRSNSHAIWKDRGLLFVSSALTNFWGTDQVYCLEYNFNEQTFSTYKVLNDEHRAVMPSAVELDGVLHSAIRRRDSNIYWIDCVSSFDDGKSWGKPNLVSVVNARNGNPPALVKTEGGLLVCVWGDRRDRAIYAKISDDGRYWHSQITLQKTQGSDLGYPHLFTLNDGSLLAVYYTTDFNNQNGQIWSTRFRI